MFSLKTKESDKKIQRPRELLSVIINRVITISVKDFRN